MDSRNHDLKENDHANNHVSKKQKHSISISDSEITKESSHHQPGIVWINNGSFRSCSSSILSVQQQWQLNFLSQPDDFYFNHLQEGILESRTVIKNLINADNVEEISIVDNATTAVAVVLQQIGCAFREGRFQKGDGVVMLHYAYGAVKKSIQAYVSRAGGYVIEAHLSFPVQSNQEKITEFRRALEEGKSNGSIKVDVK